MQFFPWEPRPYIAAPQQKTEESRGITARSGVQTQEQNKLLKGLTQQTTWTSPIHFPPFRH